MAKVKTGTLNRAQKQIMKSPGGQNFVANIPARNDVTYENGQYGMAVQSPVYTINSHETSEWDRAKAFSMMTMPLAVFVGIAMLLVAIVGFKIPALSIVALLVLVGGFVVVWAFSWGVYIFFSNTGLQMYHLRRSWNERDRANEFAEERWWHENE